MRRQFAPRISLEISASVSGERFPLQDPSVSAKLLFDVPSPAFPATASLAAGNAGPGEKSEGTSVDVAVLQDLAAGFLPQAAALSREESRLRMLQAEQQLASQVRRALAACAQKKAAAAVQRRTVEPGQRKAQILARAVDLGGAKRVDSMAAQTQLARDAGALLEAVLSLLEAERELERLLGLRPGGSRPGPHTGSAAGPRGGEAVRVTTGRSRALPAALPRVPAARTARTVTTHLQSPRSPCSPRWPARQPAPGGTCRPRGLSRRTRRSACGW